MPGRMAAVLLICEARWVLTTSYVPCSGNRIGHSMMGSVHERLIACLAVQSRWHWNIWPEHNISARLWGTQRSDAKREYWAEGWEAFRHTRGVGAWE